MLSDPGVFFLLRTQLLLTQKFADSTSSLAIGRLLKLWF